MCLVLARKIGFFTILNAFILSHKICVGSSFENPNSLDKVLSQVASFAPSTNV
jgi:hypothetical protein